MFHTDNFNYEHLSISGVYPATELLFVLPYADEQATFMHFQGLRINI